MWPVLCAGRGPIAGVCSICLQFVLPAGIHCLDYGQGDQTTIQGLLEKIQAPWNSSVVADGPSGILMKERRRFGGWTQVHCVMRQNRIEWSVKQGVRLHTVTV